MDSYTLKIADYVIQISNTTAGPDLFVSDRFCGFIVNNLKPDITIRIQPGKYEPASEMKSVFKAPYIEDIDNIPVKIANEFWNVYSDNNNNFLINIIYPSGRPGKESWLRFSLTDTEWDLFIETKESSIDALEYPLDGLILYYLTVIKSDIFIHGSGINFDQKGYLFTGVSGRGKTTMARLWDNYGGKVIHDDRLIIRNINGVYTMYNTPVYNNENPSQSPLDKIYIIHHGSSNDKQLLYGATALTNIMANCIQHNWSTEIISRLTSSLYSLNNEILVYKLQFTPDKSVVDYILSDEYV